MFSPICLINVKDILVDFAKEKFMNRKLILTLAFLVLSIFGIDTARAQDDSDNEVKSNPGAPAGYDANLKPGAQAIGSDGSDWVTEIKIVSKSNGVYKATLLESESANENVVYYKANSVYPYFNRREFEILVDEYRNQLQPYVECYARKNNLELEKVKGESSFMYDIGWGNAAEMRTKLQAALPKLAELERQLKSKLQTRPNTFLEFEANPAIVEDIAANREQYYQCVTAEKDSRRFEESSWLMAHRDGIDKILKYVETHDPTAGDELGTDSEYAFYAVSPTLRAAWLKEKKALDFEGEINKLLKPLADALAKKVPSYFPKMDKYAVHNAGDEALMKKALGNPARYKIFKIGLAQSSWDIDANALGIPNARYKNGLIYARDTTADYPYCVAVRVNVVQAYAGGGTYAASRSDFVNETLVGCPAGAK